MTNTLLTATGVWLIIVMAAILNGAFGEVILVPATGTGMALLLSGVLLTLLVFLASLASIKIIRPSSE